MDMVYDDSGRAFIPFFSTGAVKVHPLPLERLVRIHPEEVIFNLLNRAERAAKNGHREEADQLEQEAERMFRLATAA